MPMSNAWRKNRHGSNLARALQLEPWLDLAVAPVVEPAVEPAVAPAVAPVVELAGVGSEHFVVQSLLPEQILKLVMVAVDLVPVVVHLLVDWKGWAAVDRGRAADLVVLDILVDLELERTERALLAGFGTPVVDTAVVGSPVAVVVDTPVAGIVAVVADSASSVGHEAVAVADSEVVDILPVVEFDLGEPLGNHPAGSDSIHLAYLRVAATENRKKNKNKFRSWHSGQQINCRLLTRP